MKSPNKFSLSNQDNTIINTTKVNQYKQAGPSANVFETLDQILNKQASSQLFASAEENR